jgi:hypothetical protein
MNAIENKISELSSVYQQFQAASGSSDIGGLSLIVVDVNEIKNIYSGYTTVIHNLENACSAAGISKNQTLFRMYGEDFFNEKGGRKFSLGVFIIKQPTYHMTIPIKLTNKYKYVGPANDRQLVSFVASNIYKPILINSKFDGYKPFNIPGMSGFICRRGTEPAKLFAVDISFETNGNITEFNKLQIAKTRGAIEIKMLEHDAAQQQASAIAAQP